MQDKRIITEKLADVLRASDREIAGAEYLRDVNEEYVVIIFSSGYKKKICVTADSGLAMMYDVARALF